MDLSGEMSGGQLPSRVAVSPSGGVAVVIGGALLFYEVGAGQAPFSSGAGGVSGGRKLERVEAAHGWGGGA